jgi:uncharacterized membrane protein
MKKFQSAVYAAVISLMLSIAVYAAPVRAEQIDSFDATIRVQADASLAVTETIDYDFGAQQRHGIYRNIPMRYAARGGNYNLRLEDISVKDAQGGSYAFSVSDSGSDKVIKIGDADLFVTGKKTYVISYMVRRAVNYFEDHDEIYWNVTGNGWTVPIAASSAHVILPQSIDRGSVSTACHAGPSGGTAACGSVVPVFDSSSSAAKMTGVDFFAKDLAAAEGLTVVVGLPLGSVQKPDAMQSFLATLQDNWILLLPVLVFIFMFMLWWKKGRDPQGRGTIIPEYDVPDNLTPAEVGTIVDEKCGQKEIAAEIIDLAVRGFLKIKREEKKFLFIKSDDFVFTRLDKDGELNDCDINIMNGIFRDRGDVARLSEMKEDFYKSYDKARGQVEKAVEEKGYFPQSPDSARNNYYALAFLMFALAIISLSVVKIGGLMVILSLLISAIIICIFAYFMPRRTEKGVLTKEHILGLKDYLTVAEKDRLEFHNAPAKDPQQFEKLLPYAIALGVEKQWAKQFEGIYNTAPGWYDDPSGMNNFNAIYLASSLGGFGQSFAAVSAPPSASGGGSGLGGGFSGGGFGGGGGGSW